MPKVYATATGAAIRVGTYGVATDTEPVIVPEEIAAELRGKSLELRVEDDKAPAVAPQKAAPVKATAEKE